MDLYKAINELLEEKQRLDEVIARMEMLLSARQQARSAGGPIAVPSARKRGRKGMSEEERAEVSRRMKEYWAKRRKGAARAS
ncbi:MAG: hypothetical protein SFV51_19765 [Bryobacteraceae bacterium]|nr:hypothetical protein [Bryobacteraceae bacterium]